MWEWFYPTFGWTSYITVSQYVLIHTSYTFFRFWLIWTAWNKHWSWTLLLKDDSLKHTNYHKHISQDRPNNNIGKPKKPWMHNADQIERHYTVDMPSWIAFYITMYYNFIYNLTNIMIQCNMYVVHMLHSYDTMCNKVHYTFEMYTEIKVYKHRKGVTKNEFPCKRLYK